MLRKCVLRKMLKSTLLKDLALRQTFCVSFNYFFIDTEIELLQIVTNMISQ